MLKPSLLSQCLLIAVIIKMIHCQANPLPINCPQFGTNRVFCGNPNNPSECIPESQVCDRVNAQCSTGFDESQATCLLANPCEEDQTGFNTPCRNGGTCTGFSPQEGRSVAYFVCTCTFGWTGSKCEVSDVSQPQNPEPPNPINPGEEDDVYLNEPNPAVCLPNPCLNGVCTPLRDGFDCRCRPGFGGQRCETGSQFACDSRPCRNGGECLEQPGSSTTYTCSCPNGFTGRQCEMDINECESAPCLQGGLCTDLVNAFSCECPPGFQGHRCEDNVNDCQPNPCYAEGGGVCEDQVNGFRCICTNSLWTGRLCNRRQLCLAPVNDPCRNHGVCVPPTQTGNPPDCVCLDGFEGRFCEIDINECLIYEITCSGRGECLDGPNSYRCVCEEGYTGEFCEVEMDPCKPNPCKNDAFCCHRNK